MPLMQADRQQYFWQLNCGRHVQLCTPHAATRQLISHGCLRCDRCDASLHPAQRSRFERYAWEQLQYTLLQPGVHSFMLGMMPNLVGMDLGYVVEAKVLRGNLGAADMYIPALDMIIQVDGQHHDKPQQLAKDARFDATVHEQSRALLRLHHEDMLSFHKIIPSAVRSCIQRCQQVVWASLVMYSSAHPQPTRPDGSVTLKE